MSSLSPATDETLAGLAAGNPAGGPWWAGYNFWQALTQGRVADRWTLRRLVTPESLRAWGDFRAARELLAGAVPTSRAHSPAAGIAYVTFVTPPAQGLVVTAPTVIKARAIVTLQHRPELGSWRVHALGDYLHPGELPPLPSSG